MKKSMYHSFITKMYKKVTEKTAPEDMSEKQMAKAIIEQFGNRKVLTNGNEQQCEVAFKHHVEFDNEMEKIKFLRDMEGFQNRAKKPVFGE